MVPVAAEAGLVPVPLATRPCGEEAAAVAAVAVAAEAEPASVHLSSRSAHLCRAGAATAAVLMAEAADPALVPPVPRPVHPPFSPYLAGRRLRWW